MDYHDRKAQNRLAQAIGIISAAYGGIWLRRNQMHKA